jgi:hypothetical protein
MKPYAFDYPGMSITYRPDIDRLVVNGVKVSGHYVRSLFAGEIKEVHATIERRGDDLRFTSLACGRPDTELIHWSRNIEAAPEDRWLIGWIAGCEQKVIRYDTAQYEKPWRWLDLYGEVVEIPESELAKFEAWAERPKGPRP